MTKMFNKTSEKQKRKFLRSNMPQAEKILWGHLKAKQFHGHKFRRQYSVGRYVLDFYVPRLKLAIEIDGDSHFEREREKRDPVRQKYIESFGIRFLRFTNLEIYYNLGGVLETIEKFIEKNYLP